MQSYHLTKRKKTFWWENVAWLKFSIGLGWFLLSGENICKPQVGHPCHTSMEEGYVTLGTEILTYTNTIWRFRSDKICKLLAYNNNHKLFEKHVCVLLRCVMLPTIFTTWYHTSSNKQKILTRVAKLFACWSWLNDSAASFNADILSCHRENINPL